MERAAGLADTRIKPKLTLIQGYRVDEKEKIAAEIAEVLDGVQDMKSDDRAKAIMAICERSMKVSRWRSAHWFVTGVLIMGFAWCYFSLPHP